MSENAIHRPPKYVDGVYKPLFGDPTADCVIIVHTWYPHMAPLKLGTTDTDGDSKGVVRNNGSPVGDGGNSIGGVIYGDEIRINDYGELNGITEREVKQLLESVESEKSQHE